jgi:hypothetical protein
MNEVADELLRLSETKKLKWESSIRENEYRVVLPDMSFRISLQDDLGFRLYLIGDTGQAIDTLESESNDALTEQLGELASEPVELSQQHRQLKAIYKLAESYVKEEGISRALEVLRQT